MSGDVQPRKRKDKKRKKDDSAEQAPSHPLTPSPNQGDDLNIHVHKEDGTGGGICAKIIFFILFSTLAVLIGLIITEHRGLTDLDRVDTESRFSQIFEGWTDNSVSHDDEGDHIADSLDDTHDVHEVESHEDRDVVDDNEELAEEEEESEEFREDADEDAVSEDDEGEDSENVEDEDKVENSDEQTEEENKQTVESEEQDEQESEENLEEDEEDSSRNAELSAEDSNTASNEISSEEENVSAHSQEQEINEDEEKDDKEDEIDAEENEAKSVVEDENQSSSKSINVRDEDEPEEYDSDKQSEHSNDDIYEYENITNPDDLKIKEKLDEAQRNIKNNTAYAIKLFDVLFQNYSSSPRSLYGKAQSLDILAERKQSNELLKKAITCYLQLLDFENVPNALFQAAADRAINRLRFIGDYNRAIDVHKKLIVRFTNEPKYRNDLAVSYLTINRANEARTILQETLSKYSNDGLALVHYGFILKTVDNNFDQSVSYFRRGIATRAPGVADGRFYFHLGDALTRLGRSNEAMEVYEEGVKLKLFLSKYQRSLYNVEHLRAKAWWAKEETPYGNLYAILENNWQKIRDEGISVLNGDGYFQNESENLKDTGDWKQFELFARGKKNTANCKRCPFTCRIIETIPDAKGCRRGQTKFSVMHPGTHVWPHCGPTNCRLRVHLGLKVPQGTQLRVADEVRSWKNGKVVIFDDSFEHEIWHNGTTFRLVLIVDVWHPGLTSSEKRTLSSI